MRPEQYDILERRLASIEPGALNETEAEEIRLLLRRWRRIHVFFDGIGWLGRQGGRLAAWIAVTWGAIEIFVRLRS